MKQPATVLLFAGILAACSITKAQTTGGPQEQTKTSIQKFSSMNQKQKTTAFFQAVNSRNVSSYEQLVQEDYIQHNPHIPTGRAALASLFPVLEQHGTKAENIRIIEDGNFVVIHNLWTNATPFGAKEVVSFDVLRFDENGLIAEHWDALTPNTLPNPSGRTLTDGPTEVTGLDKTEANKTKVVHLFNTLINGRQEEVGAAVMGNFYPDYKQHSPVAGDGIPAVFEAFGEEEWVYLKQHKVIGEGNFVLSICEGTAKGVPSVFYDLVRFENGKIAEHWDVIQQIPTENLANDHTMFNF